jgi:competence protein ComEC
MPLLCLSIGWICGIFLGSIFSLPVWAVSFSLLPLVIIPFLRNQYKKIILAFLTLLLILGGAVYSCYVSSNVRQDNISRYNDTGIVTIQGMIADEPATRDRTATFKLDVRKLTTESEAQDISGKVLVKVSRYPEHHYGELVQVTGRLNTPQKYDDFDYKSYLAVDDIYSIMTYPAVETIATDGGSKILSSIYSIRNRFALSIDRALPEPQSAIAKGIFLGITGDIPQSIRTEFVNTGTSHILAISGLQLTIIIGLLVLVGSLIFGRQYNIHIWLALLVVWLYAVFTGLEPPVLRSAIMGSVFLLAEFLGRQRNALPALTLAAAVMLGIQPQLIGDVSFQLSYLSMCGLILVYPQFARLNILKEPEDEGETALRKIVRIFLTGFFVTISALIAIGPRIAYYFGVIPFLSIPATVFILPVFPLIVMTTALVSIIGLFLPFLAMIIGWLDWLFISYFLLVVRVFDALPLASFDLRITEVWQVWCYYIVLIIILLIAGYFERFISIMKSLFYNLSSAVNRLQKWSSGLPLKWILAALAIMVILIWTAILTLPDDKLHVSVLNVGQGDAILIQTPQRNNILIDGGPSASKLKLELGKKLPFWERNIDMVVITQAQSDHVTGLSDIIRDYKIGRIIQTADTANSADFSQLRNMIADKQIPVSCVYSSQIIKTGDIEIEVLHPPQVPFKCGEDNRDCNCLVLRLVYQHVSFLFTADIPEEVEYYLISNHAELKSTVLKVAHHGSDSSSGMQFLNNVGMKTAVISAGYDNPYGHPAPNTLASLARLIDKDNIFLTSYCGTVEYITDGDRLWVRTEQ